MSKQSEELAGLDRVVNLYVRFRAEGESVESAWRWACRIAACLESLAFEEAVQKDLDGLPVSV